MAKLRPLAVFVGPTLSGPEASGIVDAIILPPAAQGSIVRAAERYAPRAVLIIDGVFQSEPAIRHKEILWALDRGIAVLGASSMGALRAAELHPFGMIGIGLIYRWFRRFAFAPDDAVAVMHGPAELASRPLTLSLIDLLLTLRRAERRGAIDGKRRALLAQAARNLNFRDRTLANVIAAAGGCGDVDDLSAQLVDQKKADALLALRQLSRLASQPRPHAGSFVWTTAFIRDLDHAGIEIPGIPPFARS